MCAVDAQKPHVGALMKLDGAGVGVTSIGPIIADGMAIVLKELTSAPGNDGAKSVALPLPPFHFPVLTSAAGR